MSRRFPNRSRIVSVGDDNGRRPRTLNREFAMLPGRLAFRQTRTSGCSRRGKGEAIDFRECLVGEDIKKNFPREKKETKGGLMFV